MGSPITWTQKVGGKTRTARRIHEGWPRLLLWLGRRIKQVLSKDVIVGWRKPKLVVISFPPQPLRPIRVSNLQI